MLLADAVTLAGSAGTSLRDVGVAIIAALIPLAVAFILAKKALPWAASMVLGERAYRDMGSTHLGDADGDKTGDRLDYAQRLEDRR